MKIQEIPRINIPGNSRNKSYQSDFIAYDRSGSRIIITIFGNQPLYASERNQGFELIDSDTSKLMGYNSFRWGKIIIHNLSSLADRKKFRHDLETELANATRD